MKLHLANKLKSSLWLKIALPILASVILFSASIFLVHLPEVYNSLLDEKKTCLVNTTQIVMGIVRFYHSKERQGLITRREAQRQALKNITQIRFGPNSKYYFWINDLHPRMVMHPYVSELNGEDLSNYKDPTGKKLFVEMVKASEKTGHAFVSYQWQWQDNSKIISPKLSYVQRFMPWGWILGSGVYLNDIAREANRQARYQLFTSMAVLAMVIVLSSFSIWQGIRATRKIRNSEATLQGIFDQTTEFMGILDLKGNIISINRTALEFAGVAWEDVIGRPFWETVWWQGATQSRDAVHNAVLKARDGGVVKFEAKQVSHDGREIILQVSIQPIKDEASTIKFIFADGADITERKQNQEELEKRVKERTLELQQTLTSLKETQNRLVQSEKMAALGGLVAGVAHEINTPLGLGLTNATYLLEKLDAIKQTYESGKFTKGEFETFLVRVEEASKSLVSNLRRGAEIIRSFKQVAVDQEVEERRTFKVREYLDEVLTSLRPRYKRTGHSVEVDCHEDISLDTFPGVLMQVLSNLILNSLIHGFEGVEHGVIRVAVSQRGDRVILVYTDNGIGMNEEQKAKIYEPFFTTKRGSGGTGLGMHIVFNLITRKLCGEIDLETAVGKGVRFVINLPLKHPGDSCSISDALQV